jgi:hypothetical protein
MLNYTVNLLQFLSVHGNSFIDKDQTLHRLSRFHINKAFFCAALLIKLLVASVIVSTPLASFVVVSHFSVSESKDILKMKMTAFWDIAFVVS